MEKSFKKGSLLLLFSTLMVTINNLHALSMNERRQYQTEIRDGLATYTAPSTDFRINIPALKSILNAALHLKPSAQPQPNQLSEGEWRQMKADVLKRTNINLNGMSLAAMDVRIPTSFLARLNRLQKMLRDQRVDGPVINRARKTQALEILNTVAFYKYLSGQLLRYLQNAADKLFKISSEDTSRVGELGLIAAEIRKVNPGLQKIAHGLPAGSEPANRQATTTWGQGELKVHSADGSLNPGDIANDVQQLVKAVNQIWAAAKQAGEMLEDQPKALLYNLTAILNPYFRFFTDMRAEMISAKEPDGRLTYGKRYFPDATDTSTPAELYQQFKTKVAGLPAGAVPVSPEEHNAVKQELAQVKAELEEAREEVARLKQEIVELNEELEGKDDGTPRPGSSTPAE